MRTRPLFTVLLLLGMGLNAGAAIDDDVDAILGDMKGPTLDAVWHVREALGALGAGAVPVLEKRLPDASPAAKLAIGQALCDLDKPESAIRSLLELVREKDHPQLAAAAARTLGDKPARDVLATERHLLRLVRDTELDTEVRRAVASALHSAATTEESIRQAIRTLRSLLTAAQTDAERWDTAVALAEIGDYDEPVEAILTALQSHPSSRGSLARSLLENRSLRELLIAPKTREGSLGDRLLNEIKVRIQKYYVEEPPADHELSNGHARGMFSILHRADPPDPHSVFFDETDWKKFREHIAGHYGGIGAMVQYVKHFDTGDTPVFTIVKPNYDGPAYKAGLRSYDRVLKIGDTSTALPEGKLTQKHLTDIVDTLRGAAKSAIELTVTSPGSAQERKVTVHREEIKVESVHSRMLPGHIGYVRLGSFSEGSARDMSKALDALEAQSMKALIFDLRNDPGGQLQAAVAISDMFLKDDRLIVYTEGRNKSIAPREDYRTKDPTTHPDYPIVVLINGKSASASEIVSGALQDHKRATLIGETSYGKGSVQKLFPLPATAGQSGMKLTIAKYYLPSGRSIHGKGVTPDIEVKAKATYTAEDFDKLRASGAFHRYTVERFPKKRGTLAELAEFDGLDPKRYPDFDAWYKDVADEVGTDKARRLLRQWLRILVADDRGKEFVCDIQEDNQLQRAILELAKRLPDVDPKAIPEYQHFAEPPAEGKAIADAEKKKQEQQQ